MSEVLVEVWRGSFLECQHRGHAVIVNSRGDILESWGNPTQEILPRSACKILQACAFGRVRRSGCLWINVRAPSLILRISSRRLLYTPKQCLNG